LRERSGAPGNTPAEIVDRLNREVNAALADPMIKARLEALDATDLKLKTRFADLGAIVLALSPIEYGKRIAEETDKWAKVIKFSGAKAN
jgi:tripartite-type tricarboxylate transporter receptor subunit TctC